jgi:hypothetical protein
VIRPIEEFELVIPLRSFEVVVEKRQDVSLDELGRIFLRELHLVDVAVRNEQRGLILCGVFLMQVRQGRNFVVIKELNDAFHSTSGGIEDVFVAVALRCKDDSSGGECYNTEDRGNKEAKSLGVSCRILLKVGLGFFGGGELVMYGLFFVREAFNNDFICRLLCSVDYLAIIVDGEGLLRFVEKAHFFSCSVFEIMR